MRWACCAGPAVLCPLRCACCASGKCCHALQCAVQLLHPPCCPALTDTARPAWPPSHRCPPRSAGGAGVAGGGVGAAQPHQEPGRRRGRIVCQLGCPRLRSRSGYAGPQRRRPHFFGLASVDAGVRVPWRRCRAARVSNHPTVHTLFAFTTCYQSAQCPQTWARCAWTSESSVPPQRRRRGEELGARRTSPHFCVHYPVHLSSTP